MRAGNAYRLLHRRGGRWPSRFAGPERFDQIEIVDIALGETVLLWDLPSREAALTLRELRADLAQLDSDAFISRWRER
jgi:hypothetical protein